MLENSRAKDSENPFLTLLINLNSRPDRLKECEEEIQKVGILFERVPGVTGNESSNTHSRLISKPASACLDSHFTCYKLLLESDYPFALILEDDFEILNTKKFTSICKSTSWRDFDLVQVGFLYMDPWHRMDMTLKLLKNVFFHTLIGLSRVSGFIYSHIRNRLEVEKRLGVPFGFIVDDIRAGSHAYFISRSMAAQLLDLRSSAYLPIDGFLGTLQYTNKFKIIRSTKSIVGQRKSQSDIK